tara:strand:+ start:4675 stop:5283 length:609 start_codon:yes stop_codon:yes gene_type:complete
VLALMAAGGYRYLHCKHSLYFKDLQGIKRCAARYRADTDEPILLTRLQSTSVRSSAYAYLLLGVTMNTKKTIQSLAFVAATSLASFAMAQSGGVGVGADVGVDTNAASANANTGVKAGANMGAHDGVRAGTKAHGGVSAKGVQDSTQSAVDKTADSASDAKAATEAKTKSTVKKTKKTTNEAASKKPAVKIDAEQSTDIKAQ